MVSVGVWALHHSIKVSMDTSLVSLTKRELICVDMLEIQPNHSTVEKHA